MTNSKTIYKFFLTTVYSAMFATLCTHPQSPLLFSCETTIYYPCKYIYRQLVHALSTALTTIIPICPSTVSNVVIVTTGTF